MRVMRKSRLIVVGLLLMVWLPVTRLAAQTQRPNVLFIPIDDLNHWVGHLGRHPQTKTPNMDRLAAMGVSFTSAYCAAPACNPSRIALMSGIRPSTSGCYDNAQDWRPTISEDTLLNKTLLDAGYTCYGTGKILHGSYGNSDKWTEFHKTKAGIMSRHSSAVDDGVGGIKFSPLGNRDEDMPDYDAVSYGIEVLNRKHDQPFFLAVGLVKPHMPFSVPKKWFDLFPLESIELSIYPTICALTGTQKPEHVEGLDISALLQNPTAPWDTPALTTFHQNNHSFRSEQWRYIRYADGSEELYNHVDDPYEWNNVAKDANYADVKAAFASHIPPVNAPELPRAANAGNTERRPAAPNARRQNRNAD